MDTMIGKRIKERRKELKLSGAKIREHTGISTGNLSDIENGKSLPSAIALIELSKILQCSTDYILFGGARKNELSDTSFFRVDQELLFYFRELSEDDQAEILNLVKFKYERKKERKPSSSHSRDQLVESA